MLPQKTIASFSFQLTRPVWGEPRLRMACSPILAISTHSPRVGRTRPLNIDMRNFRDFNSLAPCGANHLRSEYAQLFNPFQLTRPVWGEPNCRKKSLCGCSFQLTRPVWGEPSSSLIASIASVISTHSPRVGRTRVHFLDDDVRVHFNSLAPCGANQGVVADLRDRAMISTHSPRVGRTP